MKKYIYSISLLMLPIVLSAQVKVLNNGLTLGVGDGLTFSIQEGSLTNSANGTIENDGILTVGTDFTQNTGATYTGTATSWLEFDGGISQNINSDAPLSIAKLKLANGTQLSLGNELNVGLQLDLSNSGNLSIGTNNLIMASGASLNNFDASNYIVTNNTGKLLQEVANVDVTFPVGNSSYNPVVLNNTGVTGHYSVAVVDSVFDNGTVGTAYVDDRVNRTWVINEPVVGSSNLTVTVQWDVLDELSNFDRTNCGIAYYDTCCAWNSPLTYSAAVANTTYWTQTMSNVTAFPLFTVEDVEAFLVIDNPMDKNNFDVLVFPNPTFDFVNIEVGAIDANQLDVLIYATDGKLVYQKNFDISGNDILQLEATRDLPAGTYMIQLLLDNGKYMTKKVIKRGH